MNQQNGQSSQVLHERIDSIASGLKSVADQLSSAAAAARDATAHVTSDAASRARSVRARARQAIQDHPIAAIGIAFAAGYLVLRWVRR